MYICNECGKLKDSDFKGCVKDPTNGLELICPECHEKLYDEDGKPYQLEHETADLDNQDRMFEEGKERDREEKGGDTGDAL